MKTSDQHIKQERNDKLKSAFFTALISFFFFLFIYYFSIEVNVPKQVISKPAVTHADANTDAPISQDEGTPIDSILKQDIYLPEEVAAPSSKEDVVAVPVTKTEQKPIAEQPKKHHKKHTAASEKPTTSSEKKTDAKKSNKTTAEKESKAKKSSKSSDVKTADKKSTSGSTTSKSPKETKPTASKTTKSTETKTGSKDSKTDAKAKTATAKKSKKSTEKVE